MKLKSCPFCGSKPELALQFALLSAMREYCIYCPYCGASTNYFYNVRAATYSWNLWREAVRWS